MLLPPEVAIGAFGRVRVSPTRTQPCTDMPAAEHVAHVDKEWPSQWVGLCAYWRAEWIVMSE